MGFNRNIMGCKEIFRQPKQIGLIGFNRNIMGCKVVSSGMIPPNALLI